MRLRSVNGTNVLILANALLIKQVMCALKGHLIFVVQV